MNAVTFDIEFPRFYGQQPCSGVIRSAPEDFQVDEELGFDLSGEGEHIYLQVRKKGDNTQWLAKQLAHHAGVGLQDIGYAGLKDRHALTTQWFSVWLPGKAGPDWADFEGGSAEILQVGRHHRKLKRGGHRGNRFKIRIRQLEGLNDQIETRLRDMSTRGVPNYYGEQRFGIGGGNLDQADRLLRGEIKVKDRQRRGLYLSAARSYLFNLVIAERIQRNCFDRFLEGDKLIENGTSNLSRITDIDDISRRLEQMALHPSAPLYGRGRLQVESQSLELETDILAANKAWCDGLERAGLKAERRSVRINLDSLQWRFPDTDSIELSFQLSPGLFATSVLRELCQYQNASSEFSEQK